MTLYYLKNNYGSFVEADEVYPDLHLGVLKGDATQWCLVVGCTVVVVFDDKLQADLENFYDRIWNESSHKLGKEPQDIVSRYNSWLNSLGEITEVKPQPVDRRAFASILSLAMYPPPPPNRPTLVPVPVYPPPAAPPPNVYGHLPFKAKTKHHEHFYRFEAWRTSRKLIPGAPDKIMGGTYASPSSELRFLPTGFAAVARNALPSFFPAVFRYELQPISNKDIRCGAIIPSYGQSGGGVEVFFVSTTDNNGPIGKPVIVPPL